MALIVIDVGCAVHHGDDSIAKLVSRFNPTLLLGFDPWPGMLADVEIVNNTLVIRLRAAAWTKKGQTSLVIDGWGSYTTDFPPADTEVVPCIALDLAVLVEGVLDAFEEPLVLKLNAEGAEYPLLHHLVDAGLDERLELCMVQWHDTGRVKMACPVEEYT